MQKITKRLQVFLIIALVVSLLAPAVVVVQPASPRMSTALAKLVAEDPGRMVRVIVQKANASDQAERAVAGLGGEVLMPLGWIQSFAAAMPAENVPALAQQPGVNRISVDAPVRSASLITYTVRDEFNDSTYDNQDGTAFWSGGWQEVNENDGPNSGDERIVSDSKNNRLQVRNNDGGGEGVLRSLDLSAAASAVLSFDYRRYALDDASDYVSVQISTTGTGNWTELARIAGPNSDKYYLSWSGDITPYRSPTTTIRFISSAYLGSKDVVYFDNIQIEYAVDVAPIPIEIDPELRPLRTVADDFEAVPSIFHNNSGTRNWSSAWMEVGESDGPSAGDIQVTLNSQNRSLRFQGDGLGAWRTADLSGATFAILSFDFRPNDFESGQTVSVAVSPDGGETWAEIVQIGSTYSGDTIFETASYDISAYISDKTAVQFTTLFTDSNQGATVSIDNVTILFNPPPAELPQNYYLDTLNARGVQSLGLDGSGVTVAVVDSGITPDADFRYNAFPTEYLLDSSTVDSVSSEAEAAMAFETNAAIATSTSAELADSTRILSHQVFTPDTSTTTFDNFGHGTHVAGIIGGNGYKSGGSYQGIAPAVNLISLKVSDDYGMGYESDTVAALEWIFNNKAIYNIRVVNLSIQSTVEQSYNDSALDAAAEILWFNGIVVVASAGNQWSGGYINTIKAAPANDPFIITVGASDEQGNSNRSDDVITPFTARGYSLDGYYKPEIIAPGKDIVSVLASSSWWRNDYPDRFVEGGYFRISGTSMSAPMVAGAAALLLQSEPNLTPNQVKFRLVATSTPIQLHAYLNVSAAITTHTTEAYNWHVVPHQLLAKMALIAYWASANGGAEIDWANVDWDAVDWDAVDWDAVDWDAVNWNAVNWNAVNWNAVNWNAVNWNAVNWNAVNWNAVNWNAVNWNAVNWNAVNWNAVNFGE